MKKDNIMSPKEYKKMKIIKQQNKRGRKKRNK
jgi:hypothetical protein